MTDKRAHLKRAAWVAAGLLAVVGAGAAVGWGAPQRSVEARLYEEVELLAEAIAIVQSEYVEEVEPKALIYGALRGLVGSLDRHSHFLSPDAFTEMQVETRGEFGGVGMEITISQEGILTVVAPIDDTPAAEAGLMPEDKIVKIDGKSTRGVTLHEAVKKLRGRPGTKVDLTILREAEPELFDVTLTRAVIQIRSIKEAKMVDDAIGYIRISEFQDHTAHDLRQALEKLEKEGLKGLILDLRNNPGGLLDVAVEVSETFIPEGKMIVSTKGRIEDQNQEFLSRARSPHMGYPIVVLVNGGSASASEIVAGALRDQGRAILMGTQTFGKGSVQTVVPLRDGSAIRLTTSKYYTPSGRSIHGRGLEPDVVLERISRPTGRPSRPLPEGWEPEGPQDPYILRARDLLKGILVLGQASRGWRGQTQRGERGQTQRGELQS